MNRLLLYASFILVFIRSANCQEEHLSLFYNAPLQLNPALTGKQDGDIRIGSNYRDQWRSVSYPYKTFNFFSDIKLYSEKLNDNQFGVGIQFLGDRTGTGNLSTNDLKLLLAYHRGVLKDKKIKMSLGASFSIRNHSINPERLTFETQWIENGFDPSLPQDETFRETSVMYFDMNAGIDISYKATPNMFIRAGLAINHLTNPHYSFFGSKNTLSLKTMLYSELDITVAEKTKIFPKIYLSMQDKTSELLLGCNVSYQPRVEPFYLGLWYRWGRDIIPVAGLEFKKIQLMFAYDINISNYTLATNTKGGFELSLVKVIAIDGGLFKKKARDNNIPIL